MHSYYNHVTIYTIIVRMFKEIFFFKLIQLTAHVQVCRKTTCIFYKEILFSLKYSCIEKKPLDFTNFCYRLLKTKGIGLLG